MRPSLTLIMALLTLDGVALLAFVLTDIPALIFGSMAAMGLIGGVYMIVMRSFLQSRSEADGRDTLIAAFYGIQEPFLMMGLVFLLLILPFFTASQILLGASLVEIGLSTALLLAAGKADIHRALEHVHIHAKRACLFARNFQKFGAG